MLVIARDCAGVVLQKGVGARVTERSDSAELLLLLFIIFVRTLSRRFSSKSYNLRFMSSM